MDTNLPVKLPNIQERDTLGRRGREKHDTVFWIVIIVLLIVVVVGSSYARWNFWAR
jgi:hypothetical protein